MWVGRATFVPQRSVKPSFWRSSVVNPKLALTSTGA